MSRSFMLLYHLQGVYRASSYVRNLMKDKEIGGHGGGRSQGTVNFGKTKESNENAHITVGFTVEHTWRVQKKTELLV